MEKVVEVLERKSREKVFLGRGNNKWIRDEDENFKSLCEFEIWLGRRRCFLGVVYVERVKFTFI